MKRIPLFITITVLSLTIALAGNYGIKEVKMKSSACFQDDYTNPNQVPFNETYSYLRSQRQRPSGGSRAVTTIPVGSAGNLFTILDGAVNRLAASTNLNTVVFIHRSDPTVFPNSNVGQYRYDVSYDAGATWELNYGILNPKGNQQTLAGRFPNVVLHNPVGNTNPDSAYLAYLGTWLPFDLGGSWDGLVTGVARLDNDSTSFTQTHSTPNNSDINVTTGVCNGAPGVFWATNFENLNDQAPPNFTAILLYKGIWNPVTTDVDWALNRRIVPNYDLSFDGTTQTTGLNMAFDPTGQFGWICSIADVELGGLNIFKPLFYATTDGGATWSNEISVELDQVCAIMDRLSQNDPNLSGIPVPAFDNDIVVDMNGDPHMVTLIAHSGQDYALTTGVATEMKMYDITRKNGEWIAVFLDTVATFRGDITPNVSEDNRPQASLSPDGKKVFFGWLDSDPNLTGGTNIAPNFITRAYDVSTGLATPTENRTLLDPVWDGAALFASLGPTTFSSGGNHTAPTIFAQLNNSGLDEDPAFFHYVQNITFTDASFTNDVIGPVLTVSGLNPISIIMNTTYTDSGATAMDNVDGNISVSIVTDVSNVNTAMVGSYEVTYDVSDAAGNCANTVVRTVNVIASPDMMAPVITLLGTDTISVDECDFFSDPGATASDNVDGDITANIVATSTVPSPLAIGVYTIDYDVEDGSGNAAITQTRIIIIENLPPTITLLGDNPTILEQCNSFIDQGAIAFDNCLGSVPWTSTGTVNNDSIGTYTITYSATDGMNAPITATRMVTITPDVTAPDLIVNAPNPQLHYLGDAYVDPGATAIDCLDGNVSGNVTSTAPGAVDVNTRGAYTVTYNVSDAAGNNATPKNRNVIVSTEPCALFSWTGQGGTTIKFTDESLFGPLEWLWDFGDGFQNNQPNPSHIFPSMTSYKVCLTVKNDFNTEFNKVAKDTCFSVNVATGIEDAILANAIEVYPNPTSGIVNINIKDLNLDEVTLSVHNLLGQELEYIEMPDIVSNSKYTLDLSQNAAGIYLIKIRSKEGLLTKKITLYSRR